jgi:hypothetical protein
MAVVKLKDTTKAAYEAAYTEAFSSLHRPPNDRQFPDGTYRLTLDLTESDWGIVIVTTWVKPD